MAKGPTPASVQEYITGFDSDTQERLNQLRKILIDTLPSRAQETINWGMPTYRVNGKIVLNFATFKHHTGLFVGADNIQALGGKLDGSTTSKAVIHLPHDKPLPKALIKTVVRQAAANPGLDSKPAKRQKQTMPAFVARELKARGLKPAYAARPPYQRNDYLSWITSAKQESTKLRRLEQMLGELESDKYMGMDYQVR